MRKKIFTVEKSPIMEDYYIINVNHEDFHLESTSGSFNIIMARLFCISYADFLRLCRDEYEGEIFGKNTYYPVPYFYKRGLIDQLCAELNARANLVLFEYDNPDYPAHYAEVKRYEEELYGNDAD